MKLYNLFSTFLLVSYTALTNPVNVNSNKSVKVKRANSDCQNIKSLLDQIGLSVDNCCNKDAGISCNSSGRITAM